jgi:DNA polymerase elongation subunit (family B)
MDTKDILEIFKRKPYMLRMGKGLLSKRLGTTPEKILQAKKTYYGGLSSTTHQPKILILDIETAPMRGYIFSLWKDTVNLDKLISDWYIISWSAKWLFNKEVLGDVLTCEEAKHQDDRRVVISLSRLLNEADIIITHNGKRFDLPKINARALIHQLPPIKPNQTIDTFEVAKRQFGFTSNKLDYLARVLGIDVKLDTDFKLWSACVDGDPEALKYMLKYNKWDVECLEAVYLRLRPWIRNHPNLALYYESDRLVCPNCGSEHLISAGYYYTTVNKYQVYRCECGAISRVRNSSLSQESKKFILNNNIN